MVLSPRLALTSVALLAACAGAPDVARSPVAITRGERTRVLLTEVASGRTFGLQNASSGSAEEIYSAADSNRSLKVVADANLQELLDVLAAAGMFTKAGDQPAPGARDLLVVDMPERSYVWSRLRRGIDPAEQSFHEARSYFLTFYNQVTAFHNVKMDPDALRAENERVRRSADAARARLEQQTGSRR
jgi:hypothetical protein